VVIKIPVQEHLGTITVVRLIEEAEELANILKI
jgi:hypothetical protein